jgi:hypothetical protein
VSKYRLEGVRFFLYTKFIHHIFGVSSEETRWSWQRHNLVEARHAHKLCGFQTQNLAGRSSKIGQGPWLNSSRDGYGHDWLSRGLFLAPWNYALRSLGRTVQCNHALCHFFWCRLVAYDALLLYFWSHFGPVVWMHAVSFVVLSWCAYHTHHYRYFFLLSSLSDNG